MTADEIKKYIEEQTGIPAAILKGETKEEIMRHVELILAGPGEDAPKTPREQFAEWAEGIGDSMPVSAPAAPEGYPVIQDGGQPQEFTPPETRSPREQFAEWIKGRTDFNPHLR